MSIKEIIESEVLKQGKDLACSLSSKIDTIDKGLRFIVNNYQRIKLYWFYKGISQGKNISSEDIEEMIVKFGDKEVLSTYVVKQLDAAHKEGNIISGLIVRKALENGEFSGEQINHIELLLTLNESDFKNLREIMKLLKDMNGFNSDVEQILEWDKIKEIQNIRTTMGKLNSYGYNKNETCAGLVGIFATELLLNLYSEYLLLIW